jgi:twitching motility protein PilT
MGYDFSDALRHLQQMKGSDLHITAGLPPVTRIDGRLVRFGDVVITPEDSLEYAKELLSHDQFMKLERDGEIDCSLSVMGKYRYRLNVFRQRGSYALAMRNIDNEILSLAQLGLPEQMRDFTQKSRGIFLVTGPTGSGKTTTLASLINIINHERDCHIITLEDPIEFLHKHDKSIINQREIGSDTKNYHNALRSALREDPDVILVGEMRDYESIAIAITAAETGHLVFSTLHTVGAAQTIDRIIDVFPPNQQQQIRTQLSMTLLGIASQVLIPDVNNRGRKVAVELMYNNSAIANLIRESKTSQINNAIITGAARGMVSMDNSLLDLYRNNYISHEELFLRCVDRDYVEQNILRGR